MVEVFSIAAGQSGAADRSVSNDVRLSVPSDVYLGSGVAGIAYYEKSGADLKVTLLDGQGLILRDFFVIGPAGEYSRLRDGGSAGPIEVTGLIAPEPFVPPDTTPRNEVAERVEDAPQPAAPPARSESGETVIDVTVGSDGSATAVAGSPAASFGAESGGNSGFSLGGVPLDGALFGLAMLPAAYMSLRDDDDRRRPSDPPPQRIAAGNDEPTVAATGEADADVADLIAGIMAGGEDALFAAAAADEPVRFVDDDGALHDIGAAADPFGAFLGDMIYSPSEG